MMWCCCTKPSTHYYYVSQHSIFFGVSGIYRRLISEYYLRAEGGGFMVPNHNPIPPSLQHRIYTYVSG